MFLSTEADDLCPHGVMITCCEIRAHIRVQQGRCGVVPV